MFLAYLGYFGDVLDCDVLVNDQLATGASEYYDFVVTTTCPFEMVSESSYNCVDSTVGSWTCWIIVYYTILKGLDSVRSYSLDISCYTSYLVWEFVYIMN